MAQRLLNCTPPTFERTVCVQASPNPEFANSPNNFAHWWMAHVYPLSAAMQASGTSEAHVFRSRLLIRHGNNRVLPKWAAHYLELLGGGACLSQKSVTERRWLASCSVVVRVSTPVFSFRNRSFYPAAPWQAFARALRRSPLLSGWPSVSRIHTASAHTVVLLRESGSRGGRTILGLQSACAHATCIRPSAKAATLSQTARTLRAARALLAGHGAALAMLPFMEAGSKLLELDHVGNVARSRNMYQYLASALGLEPIKVWLDSNGTRYCPQRTIGCTAAGGGSTVHGCSVGYRANVTVTSPMLACLLDDAAAPSTSPRLAVARRCSGVQGDDYRGPWWWRLEDELRRPYPT